MSVKWTLLAALLLAAGCGTAAGSDEQQRATDDDGAATVERTDDGSETGEGTEQRLGPEAQLPVAGTDLVEIRRVVSGPDDAPEDAGADQLPTAFGRYAVHVAALTDADDGFEDLVTAMVEARYVDTGGVVYDLSNPDYEVVFFQGDEALANLGYYEELGPWGKYDVPGRWMDEDWGLLAVTTELPADLLG